MIRCVAVDDEPLALELIKSYISKTSFLELAGYHTNAFDALNFIQTENIDLLFLDIQMPEITGIDIAASIDTFKTKVVFTTAFDNYALEGFRVDAIDYLLKPINYPNFLRSAKKAQRMIEGFTDSIPSGSLVVKADYRLIKIDYKDILYFESMRDYVNIVLENGSNIKTLSTLKGFEATLPSPPFRRVQRSFIVNIPKVNVVERHNIVFGKKYIPVSESYRDELSEFMI